MLGFRHKLSKVLVFINQIPLFHENPVSSVRPSEASSGRFLCFHLDSGGGVGFSIQTTLNFFLSFLSFFFIFCLSFFRSFFLSFFPGGTHWPQLGEPGSAWNVALPLKTSSKNPSIVPIVREYSI